MLKSSLPILSVCPSILICNFGFVVRSSVKESNAVKDCGKSTLLRGFARVLRPTGGSVLLDGRTIHELPTRQVAQQVGLLPQSPTAPDGLTVEDLVGRGRYPHQSCFQRWTDADHLVLEGTVEGTAIRVGMHRRDDAWRLVSRGFHWVNEFPYNR